MLNCKQVSELVSQSLDRRLSLRERLGVRMHLLMCDMCRRYRRQLLFLSRASRRLLGRDTRLPPEARRRISDRLREESRDES